MYKIIRGGSWFDYTMYARVSEHDYWQPGDQYHDQGFRIVMKTPLDFHLPASVFPVPSSALSPLDTVPHSMEE